jgi:hypothetical protein
MKDNSNEIKEKISFYLKIAFEAGINKAVEAILKQDNAYLLDEFHDQLIFEIRKRKGDF